MRRLTLIAVAALLLTGCRDFKDDVQEICDAPDHVPAKEGAKSSERLSRIGEYLEEKVTTKDGKKFLTFLADLNRAERQRVLKNISMQQGIVVCHLADMN